MLYLIIFSTLYMKIIKSVFLSFFLLVFITCTVKEDTAVKNIKDLDENMIDLRMYHELMGDELKKGDIEDARWFKSGLDSVLMIVASKFDEHRKLDEPFIKSYERNLKPTLEVLGEHLGKNDLAASKEAYVLLTQKCNGCHKDNDIDKEVQNWLIRGQ